MTDEGNENVRCSLILALAILTILSYHLAGLAFLVLLTRAAASTTAITTRQTSTRGAPHPGRLLASLASTAITCEFGCDLSITGRCDKAIHWEFEAVGGWSTG